MNYNVASSDTEHGNTENTFSIQEIYLYWRYIYFINNYYYEGNTYNISNTNSIG